MRSLVIAHILAMHARALPEFKTSPAWPDILSKWRATFRGPKQKPNCVRVLADRCNGMGDVMMTVLATPGMIWERGRREAPLHV